MCLLQLQQSGFKGLSIACGIFRQQLNLLRFT
jgi:hypothetical protein